MKEESKSQSVVIFKEHHWDDSNRRLRIFRGKHKRYGEYAINLYDFKQMTLVPDFEMSLMQDKKAGQNGKYRRSVLLQIDGEEGIWLNIFSPLIQKRPKKNNPENVNINTWYPLNRKGKGISTAFACKESYPEFDVFGEDLSGSKWIEDFKTNCDDEFGENKYAVVPWAAEPYNKTAIPFIGIAISELGLGRRFLLKIGDVIIKGEFDKYGEVDSGFGQKKGSAQDRIGKFDYCSLRSLAEHFS